MNLYNHNANINYPFVDDIELPFSNGVLLDLRVQVEARPGLTYTPEVLVTSLVRTDNSFALILKIEGVTHSYSSAPIALGAEGYTSFQLTDLTSRVLMVVGAEAYDGTTLISDVDGYEIRPACVIDVASFELTSLTVGGTAYIGDVILKAGRNAQVRTSASAITITFALNKGNYVCDGSGLSDCDKFLHFLNGAGPDNSGSVSIVGGKGIKVTNYPAASAIDIMAIPEDECSV